MLSASTNGTAALSVVFLVDGSGSVTESTPDFLTMKQTCQMLTW